VANIIGIGLATLFRLYCYRRWVFLYAEGEAPAVERLEPETSGAPEATRLPAFADPEREVSGFQDALHHPRSGNVPLTGYWLTGSRGRRTGPGGP